MTQNMKHITRFTIAKSSTEYTLASPKPTQKKGLKRSLEHTKNGFTFHKLSLEDVNINGDHHLTTFDFLQQ